MLKCPTSAACNLTVIMLHLLWFCMFYHIGIDRHYIPLMDFLYRRASDIHNKPVKWVAGIYADPYAVKGKWHGRVAVGFPCRGKFFLLHDA